MNVSKRQNEHCDIPGFDASKGERIVRALQKLWEKIQYLEQSRTFEKSESESLHSSKEDFTLTDVQYRLLIIQLQYVRSLLRKRCNSNNKVFTAKISEDEHKYKFPTIGRNTAGQSVSQDIVNEPYSAKTQTVSNSVAGLNLTTEHNPENVQVTSDTGIPRFKHSTEESVAVYQKPFSSKSKPHYHLKLDDVPFILGASSTASHSVVANVQNIIAMMKSHNKALCGPKPNASRSTVANAHSTDILEKTSTGENSQDVTKLLNDLSRDLCALAAKQQRLAECIDATQLKKHESGRNLATKNQNQENMINSKPIENDDSRTYRSFSASEVKLHAEVKKIPKEKDFAKYSVQSKQNAYNIRPQASNLSIMDRRKLLRSLQNFKKHLSAEDISWD